MPDKPTDGFDEDVMVFRNPAGPPVAVPYDVVLEAQRPYRAYMRHQKGEGWDLIANEENYPSVAACQSDIRRYLTEGRVLVQNWTQSEMLALEIQRLNMLQAAVWEGAMKGNLPSVSMAVSIVRERVRILHLDELPDETAKTRTIVVTEGDYVSDLQRAASD